MGGVRSDDRPGDELETAVRRLQDDAAGFRLALKRLGEALGSTRDRQEMIAALLETAGGYLGARAGVFYLLEAGREKLKPIEALVVADSAVHSADPAGGPPVAGASADATSVAANLAAGEGLAGEAARTGAMAVWPGPVAPAPGEPAQGADNAVAVPLRPGGHTFGVVAFYGRVDEQPDTAEDLEAVAILVGQAETAIDRSFLYEEATRLSLTDGLTGLSNRRHFDLRLEAELSRAVRFSETFAVLMTDVDRFKPVNDSFGHQAGDTVLVELAGRMSGAVRDVDLVSRFGGDEFTLLLPKTGLAGALRLGDKMRAAVSARPFAVEGPGGTPNGGHGGEMAPLTLSVGVSAYPEHGATARELVVAADRALYRAKAKGGDQVEHARIGDRFLPGGEG